MMLSRNESIKKMSYEQLLDYKINKYFDNIWKLNWIYIYFHLNQVRRTVSGQIKWGQAQGRTRTKNVSECIVFFPLQSLEAMAAIGWYGPLIDLAQVVSHVDDLVQLLVFVRDLRPVVLQVHRFLFHSLPS